MRVTDSGTRYEARLDDDDVIGYAEYERQGSQVVFTHTVVQPSTERKGVGSALVQHAVEDVRARGLEVVAQCSFVRAWLAKHP